jgi:amino acid adenylation domain-containing protein
MPHSTESVSDLDYWKNYLSDAEPCHFPAINGGSVGDVSCLKHVDIELPAVSSLEFFCEMNQISVDALFQSTWGLLLRCYCGIDAVCFGLINEHVTVSKTQTSSPCYLELAADTSILRIRRIVELQIQESRKHFNCTLEEIQQALELGNQSLFNTVVHISEETYFEPISEREGDGIPQIQLRISLRGENTNASVTFHPSILSHSQALNVASALTQALDCILHPLEATQRVCDVDLFSDYHRTQISSWNSAVRPKLALHCLHDDVQKQIDSIPDDTAVIAWDEKFTYREVGELSNRLANHLINLGVGPEVFVPFLFEKSAWAVIAILAIVKAGGAIVGLDPSHPTQRLREIVGLTGARIILSSELNRNMLTDAVDEIVIVSRHSLEALPANITTPKTLAISSNALYITFTSGSTGQPKGVIVEHGSYNSTILVLKKEMDIGRYTRVLQAASFAFSPSILETIGALAFGACVCIPSQAAREANFGAVLSDMRINYATLTPSVLKAIKPDSVKELRNLMLFGEPMTEEAVRIWSKRTNLFNGWGSTEAGLITLKTDLRSLSDVANVGHCRGFARIVDPTNHERQVPIGAVGELILHAPWLARGYLNDPEKTAVAFLERPDWLDYRDEDYGYGARFYKIGDLVRQNSDGSLSFAGRRDNMVKLRGQRLELGEVERNISSLEGVQHSLVMVPTSGLLSDPRRLIAVIALAPNELIGSGDKSPPNKISLLSGKNSERAAAAVERFRESLLQKLPIYMVPTVWIMVHSIPPLSFPRFNHR